MPPTTTSPRSSPAIRTRRSLTVVTSDGELAARVRAAGGEVEGAGAFLRRLDATPQPHGLARVRAVQLSELVAPPAEGRVFTDRARAGLGDVAPSGRVRLDTIARWLQDAAFADLAGLRAARRRRVDRAAAAPARRALPAHARARRGGDVVQRRRRPRGRAPQHRARRRRAASSRPWRCGSTSTRRARGRARCPRASRRSTAPRRRGAACARACATAASRPTAATAPVALSRRRPRPRRPRQQRGLLAGARGGARRDGAREPFDAEIEHRAPGDVGEAAILRAGHMLWIADGNGEVLASLATPGWTVGPGRN